MATTGTAIGGFARLRQQAAHTVPPTGFANVWVDASGNFWGTLPDGSDVQLSGGGGGGPPLSGANPQPLGSVAPGTSADCSRADHVHAAIPAATDSVAGLMAAFDKAYTDQTQAGFVFANLCSGSDIGAQINAACAQLGANGGTIYVDLSTTPVLSTQVIVTANITLLLGSGTLDNNFTGAYKPMFQLHSNVVMRGAGMDRTTIIEPALFFNGSEYLHSCVYDYASWQGYLASGGSSNVPGESNIEISDIHFLGKGGNAHVDEAGSTISFGACQNVRVLRNHFDNVNGFGVSSGVIDSSPTPLYADGVYYLENIFDTVAAQNAVVINAINFFVDDNIFRGLSAYGPGYIDCENNSSTDRFTCFSISRNKIFPSGSNRSNPSPAIQLAGGNPTGAFTNGRDATAMHGVISDNIIIGGDPTLGNGTYLTAGIVAQSCSHVVIANNCIMQVTNAPIYVSGSGMLITGNKLTSCGAPGGYGISLADAANCVVSNNFLDSAADPTSTSWHPSIGEILLSDYNTIVGNHLSYFPKPGVAPAGGVMLIDVLGTHTARVGNFVNGQPVDGPLIPNVTQLGLTTIPGAAATGFPAVVALGGLSAQGDGGAGIYTYDPSSTRTANGITVVSPQFQTGNGRWIRSPGAITLTTTARNALSLTSADEGLEIYNTTTHQFEYWNGSAWGAVGSGGGGSGTVTSVALTVPSFLSVSGSPVTTSGTLAVALATQSAHAALIGPASGSAAAPTFRALVAADLPTVPDSGISYANESANTVFSGPSTGSPAAPTYRALVAADLPTIPDSKLSYATESANKIFAGPASGSAAAPTYRSLVTADLPTSLGWSAAQYASTAGVAIASGNFTVGMTLRFLQQVTVTGIKFWWPGGGGALTVTATLWDSTNTSVGSASVAVNTAGIYTATFTGVSVSSSNVYKTYTVGIYETTGTKYVNVTNFNVIPSYNSGFGVLPNPQVNPWVQWVDPTQESIGNARPATSSGVGGGIWFPVEPVVSPL